MTPDTFTLILIFCGVVLVLCAAIYVAEEWLGMGGGE